MVGTGLVGYGYWGPKLAKVFYGGKDRRLAAICEQDPERARLAARQYPGMEVCGDYDDFLKIKGLDAIIIATSVSTHFALARKALEAGKDVFLEKPMAKTPDQAEALLSLAEKNQRILGVDHTFLFTGAIQKIKQLVDSGELGDLLYFDSVRVNLGLFQQDINVIDDLAPHDLSILCHLIPQDPVSVMAMGARHVDTGFENLAYLHIEYESGFVAHFHLNWLSPVKVRRTLIAGNRKMIVYDDLAPSEKVKVYDKGIHVEPDKTDMNKLKFDYRTGDMWAPKLGGKEPLKAIADHFIRCVADRKTPFCGGQNGLRVVRLLAACQQSLEKNGEKIYLKGNSV